MYFSDANLPHLQSKLADKKICLQMLDAAIGQAINNPLLISKAKQGVGFDLIAYMDALFLLSEVLEESCFHFSQLSPQLLSSSCVVQWDFDDSPINQEISPDVILAKHSALILNVCACGEDYSHLKRLMGFHNLSSNQVLFEGKKINIIVPFEMVVLINKQLLPAQEVPASLMFALEPLNPAFSVHITPAPVHGVIIDNNMQGTQGYVVHPNILFDELLQNDSWRDEQYKDISDDDLKTALKWDTQLALKVLKHRYQIDISPEYLTRVGEMDHKIKKLYDKHGAVVLEI